MIGLEGRELYAERLSFRLLEPRDQQALYAIVQDPQVTEPAGYQAVQDWEGFVRFWENLTRDHTGIAILLEGECIGYLHVYPCEIQKGETPWEKNISLGFLLGKSFHGKGYMTETLKTLVPYLLTRTECVWGDYFSENVSSRKTLERCGFRQMGSYEMVFEELGGTTKQVVANCMTREDLKRLQE